MTNSSVNKPYVVSWLAAAMLGLCLYLQYGAWQYIGLRPSLSVATMRQLKTALNSPELSISRLQTHVTTDPEDVKAWLWLARLYTKQQQADAAIAAQLQVWKLDSSDHNLRALLSLYDFFGRVVPADILLTARLRFMYR